MKRFRVVSATLLLAVVLSLLPGPAIRKANASVLRPNSIVNAACNNYTISGLIEAPADQAVIRQNRGTVISGYVTQPAGGCFAVVAIINGTQRLSLPVEYAYRGAGFGWAYHIRWPARATSASLGHPHTIQVMVVTYNKTKLLDTIEGKTTISVLVIP